MEIETEIRFVDELEEWQVTLIVGKFRCSHIYFTDCREDAALTAIETEEKFGC
jgi:hypothetical protein